MIIAIHPDNYGINDSSSPRWAELLETAGHQVRWVDVRQADILDQLEGCQGFMWRHAHFGEMQQIAKRLLPVIENELSLIVYPDQKTCWHYDDKIAQAYLFEALNIPSPKTWVWFDKKSAHQWAAKTEYPVVLKLFAGAGSTNVKLIHVETEAHRWINRLFGSGTYSLDETYFYFKNRLERAWKIIEGQEAFHEIHHGYALFQEFLPNNDYDNRITIIGKRAFGFRRFNRPGDFRASGSGLIDYDKRYVDEKFVRLAFSVAKRLDTQSCAIDGLWKNKEAVVGEVSYTYVSGAVECCPGHWELNGEPETGDLTWVDGRMWPEEAQIKDFLKQLAA